MSCFFGTIWNSSLGLKKKNEEIVRFQTEIHQNLLMFSSNNIDRIITKYD
jgi:hypothetical protein